MFTLPENFTSSIGTNATGVISALAPYTTLILGVLLATLVITVLIKSLTGHK